MNSYLLLASLISFGVCLVHIFLGGREVVDRLFSADTLESGVKWTLYYCWHLISITLAAMAIAFLLAAMPNGSRELGLFASLGAGAFGALSMGLVVGARLNAWQHPQWIMFFPVFGLGVFGLWG